MLARSVIARAASYTALVLAARVTARLPGMETLTRQPSGVLVAYHRVEADQRASVVDPATGAVRDVLKLYASAIDTLIASGVERGEVRGDADVPLLRRMLIGALEEIELEWLLGERTRPLTPLAPRFAAAFYRGMAPAG